MASPIAKLAAQKVSERIRKGKKVVLGEVLREVGYSQTTSLKPKLVTNTKTYKREMEPLLKKLEEHRDKIIEALANKDLDKERYSDLTNGLNTITKNIQLLSGGETDRVGVTVELVKYGDDTPTT